MAPIKLLTVDRTPVRLGIRMALHGQVEVCAEAGTVEHAIRAAKRHQPDLCLIGRDLCGEQMGTIRAICRAAPNAAVVVLASVADEDDLLEAIRAGAVGYVPGEINADRLRSVVRAVMTNEAIVPRAMVLELVMELRGSGGKDALTTRESQVLGMVRRGHSTAAIAERLGIAPVTVRRHISDLVHKMGVEHRSALIGGPFMARAGANDGPDAQTLNAKSADRLIAH